MGTLNGRQPRECGRRSWSTEPGSLQCLLNRAAFERCNLSGVAFDGSDLQGCRFEECDLTSADLRSARNYLISPLSNKIAGMRVSLPEALGLLAAVDVVVE
ncbi:MAG: pentapeptide repeat-containing protein [Trueperaceae bacterium]